MGNDKGTREGFGNVQQLRSGRWQARWKKGGRAFTAKTDDGHSLTFAKRTEARRWLNSHEEAIRSGAWPPAPVIPVDVRTFADAAEEWMSRRDLQPRTADHYRSLLRLHLLPTFGHREVADITRADVGDWWHGLTGKDTARRHAYTLMRSVLAVEVDHDRITANPCRLDKRELRASTPGVEKHETTVLDDRAQLAALVAAMPERHRLLVDLATVCALRFGEVTALRRRDLDLDAGLLHVHVAVARVPGQPPQQKDTKTKAGKRDLPLPSRLVDPLRAHLAEHVDPGPDALVFPATSGGYLAPSAFYGRAPKPATKKTRAKPGSGFYAARAAIGRPDLHFHDLRHTGLTWLGEKGTPPQVLALYAGHAGLGMVARYSMHETPNVLRKWQDEAWAD
ncbi:site-specific integrase [Nocardioides sp. 31GB23]|uniref:tyrosine-type recombinase/integrase n=1 Tax=Nocardioides sp. 31GB23 TaxID=3156065 RepID=UPI0032AE8712